ncbi:MAG: YbaB/EbfC family nucleoid-associated protein [Planctomycetota bacterium]|nr:YbaB/EbfC family nucleoid-associated protein [Planctomycetota bacterium]MDA1251778.1 YbaB/EbfC family nucleoid-associated protein [Planctomycetota bacterium]
MFKGIGDFAAMLKQAGAMKGQFEEMQSRMSETQNHLAQMRIRGSAGGGMVNVEINGKLDVLGCRIDQTLVDSGDREMLEDLVTSAMNDAIYKSKQAAADAMKEVTGGLDIPGIEEAMAKLGGSPD